jgi:hypothetical protein
MSTYCWSLFAVLAAIPFGSLSANEPVPVVVEDVPAPAPSEEARDHTYFLVVNGMDPLFVAKLNCFCDGIRCAGYKNVELYKLRNGRCTEQRVCEIRKDDPGAKIVLVGYSMGAGTVSKVCNSLDCSGIWVDMLVYIGADYMKDTDAARPKNAGRILNINGHGFIGTGGDLLFNGTAISGAANYRVNARHFGLPKQPETLGLVLDAVAELHVEKKTTPAK